MGLIIFNTLSRSLEPFVPLDSASKKVGMYCCGPTVHNFAHIGNFRTFVCADMVRRYLTFCGYEVKHVMNITDVEDKIIAAVARSSQSLRDYTTAYQTAFLDDFQKLGCLKPDLLPRATDFIAEIINLIETLTKHGFAYRMADGSVYFSIDKYREAGRKYGQLLPLNFEEMKRGERVRADEYAKESVGDFALWKGRVPEDGAVFWPSPWGEGRPGWHIECSAMSMKLLGTAFDLHLGGEDLIFPHHEDEIAQSEGACLHPAGEHFVRYWLHVAHLLVEGKKMAKSLGNFFTLRDLLGKGIAGREIRYLLISSHYRESFNFTLEGLSAARSALSRLDDYLQRLRGLAGQSRAEPNRKMLEEFTAGMDQDFNVSAAWGTLFATIREQNRLMDEQKFGPAEAASALAAWERINSVFGLETKSQDRDIPGEISALLEQRQAARKARDFARGDQIRETLKSNGWLIEDTPSGPRLKKT